LKLVSRANELRQLIDRRLLLIDGKLRVTDDVDEQHLSDLESDGRLLLGSEEARSRIVGQARRLPIYRMASGSACSTNRLSGEKQTTT
jgi:hypothetical protein